MSATSQPDFEKLLMYHKEQNLYYFDGYSIYFYQNPFNNCQTFSILSMGSFLQLSFENQKKMLKIISSKFSKRQFICDILSSNLAVLKTYYKDCIKICSEYKNKTGSNMAIVLIDFEPLINR